MIFIRWRDELPLTKRPPTVTTACSSPGGRYKLHAQPYSFPESTSLTRAVATNGVSLLSALSWMSEWRFKAWNFFRVSILLITRRISGRIGNVTQKKLKILRRMSKRMENVWKSWKNNKKRGEINKKRRFARAFRSKMRAASFRCETRRSKNPVRL